MNTSTETVEEKEARLQKELQALWHRACTLVRAGEGASKLTDKITRLEHEIASLSAERWLIVRIEGVDPFLMPLSRKQMTGAYALVVSLTGNELKAQIFEDDGTYSAQITVPLLPEAEISLSVAYDPEDASFEKHPEPRPYILNILPDRDSAQRWADEKQIKVRTLF